MTGRQTGLTEGVTVVRSQTRRRACIVRQNDIYDGEMQREAEALASAGFDVEVLCLRAPALRRARL